jgi:hypothetical protein
VLRAVVLLVLVGWFFVLPWVRAQAMTIPVVNGLAAVQRGDPDALRTCFTDNAYVKGLNGELLIGVSELIDEEAADLKAHPPKGEHLEFSGFRDVRDIGDRRVAAKFSIVTHVSGEDIPYRSVPVKMDFDVSLERTGFVSWQMTDITPPDSVVEMVKEEMSWGTAN